MWMTDLYLAARDAQSAAEMAAADCSFASDAEVDAMARGDLDNAPTFAKARELARIADEAHAEWERAFDEYEQSRVIRMMRRF